MTKLVTRNLEKLKEKAQQNAAKKAKDIKTYKKEEIIQALIDPAPQLHDFCRSLRITIFYILGDQLLNLGCRFLIRIHLLLSFHKLIISDQRTYYDQDH